MDYNIPPQSHMVDYKPDTILELQKAGWDQEELSYSESNVLALATASWNKESDIWRKLWTLSLFFFNVACITEET